MENENKGNWANRKMGIKGGEVANGKMGNTAYQM